MKRLAVPVSFEKRTGNILDIGSGNNALEMATHLLDLMPEDNTERGGSLEKLGGRQFVQGNIEALPFKDDFFDFAHASHVLEHVESPARALAELMRTSSSGYIETPAPVFEQLMSRPEDKEPGWPFHRWYVWTFPDNEKIYFKPKTPKTYSSFCSCKAGQTVKQIFAIANFAKLDPLMPYSVKMTQFVWQDHFQFEVWSEDQMGTPDTRYGCTCYYASFSAFTKKFFKSLRHLDKRLKLRSRLPEVYEFLRSSP